MYINKIIEYVQSENSYFIEKIKKDAIKIRESNFGKYLHLYFPTMYPYKIRSHSPQNRYKFVSTSVTGNACALKCDHCMGTMLHSMNHTTRPQDLYKLAKKVHSHNGYGLLISGGALSDGRVPLEKFLDTIKKIKHDFELIITVHTGIPTRKIVDGLHESEVDSVMIDVIGDINTMKNVYHLKRTPEDIYNAIRLFNDYSIPVTPHILIGLNYGKIVGEWNALRELTNFNISALVFIILIPLRNTPMANVSSPSPNIVQRMVLAARLLFPLVPINIGCARPMGDHKINTDILSIDAGANGLVYPSQEGVDYAISKGFQVIYRDICCSMVNNDIILHKLFLKKVL